MKKQVVSKTREFQPSYDDELLLDDYPRKNSFNTVTSDGVARAIEAGGGGGGSLTPGDGITIDEGVISVTHPVPDPEGHEDQVLGVSSKGDIEWVNAGGGGTTYTAGPGIQIEHGEISAHVNNYVNNQLKIDTVYYPTEHTLDRSVEPVTATVYGESQTILPYFGLCTSDLLEASQSTNIDFHLLQDWVLSSGGTANDVRYTYALVNINDMATANYQQPYTRMYVCGDVVVPVEVGSDAGGPIWGFPSGWTLGFDLNYKNTNLSTIDIEDVQANPSDYAFVMLHCNDDGTQLVSGDALVSITTEQGSTNTGWFSWTTWGQVDDVICLSNPIPRPDINYGGQFLKISDVGDWVFGSPESPVWFVDLPNTVPSSNDEIIELYNSIYSHILEGKMVIGRVQDSSYHGPAGDGVTRNMYLMSYGSGELVLTSSGFIDSGYVFEVLITCVTEDPDPENWTVSYELHKGITNFTEISWDPGIPN